MGGWVLEVAKMALYLTFPVAAFHVFNSPEYFEKYVIEKKREMYPHEDELYREEVNQLFRDMNNGNLDNKIKQFNKMESERKNRQETNAATATATN
ncbi:protein PET100 homolog, mitochondrial [Contarinia nasturtii]|uniref:protein PET100 homolog, mitochondrial n=1 Tax=Contarinia nasturtii TaxID=265458 RepID=UPI0012D495B4|nr:protein PET100 homolog, mitochondrial [Contarinia nasturtii]XP_031631083.1 protein PET100 homolog, mitochondrial [Contarinia nasturtii]XP_031631091.1 protein PET100 homolog, mitochondrial [Contarinia nasturtii]XP_031631102.1 protein PET100 homolog, mitochondrial [Contarinia nasturtii]